MGYRSQVSFTIIGPRDKILSHLVAYRLQGQSSEKTIDHCRFILDGSNMIIKFYADDWKWYSGDSLVDSLEQLYEMYRDLDSDEFNGAFVRIGEDVDDTETRYFGPDPYDLEQIMRSINSQYLAGVKLEELGGTS